MIREIVLCAFFPSLLFTSFAYSQSQNAAAPQQPKYAGASPAADRAANYKDHGGICPIPTNLGLGNNSDALVVPQYPSGRPLIANDYLVIEYDARNNLGTWTDYKKNFLDKRSLADRTYPLNAQDSFLPVIYTKEKVAVRICGFHFTDVISVTTAVNGIVENGADIRGVSPVTPPAAISSTFDTLQSGVATGGTTMLPGVGLGAPAAIPSLAVTGITLGNLGAEDPTPGKLPTYTGAAATASGKQVALLLYSMVRNAVEESRLIERTMGKPYPTHDTATSDRAISELKMTNDTEKEELKAESGSAPGSVNGVKYILGLTLDRVKVHAKDPTASVNFDQDMIDIQNINAQITTLASSLSSQAYATNTIALLNNFSALTGILDLAKLGVTQTNCQAFMPALQPGDISKMAVADLNKLKLADFATWTASQLTSLSKSQIDSIADSTLRAELRSIQKALVAAGVPTTNSANDKPLCSAFEKQKLTDFWDSYKTQIRYLMAGSNPADLTCKNIKPENSVTTVEEPEDYEGFSGCELAQLNAHIDTLRGALREIDVETTELYDRMNEWNRGSSIEHTDVLLPLPQNSDVKISIVVQRGYTPFTLASASGTITPTATTNAVPLAPGTASSSTPAHAPRIVHLQVHRLANFNLVGGAMLMHIPTASFATQASPTYATPSSGSPTGYTGTCGGATVNVPVSATQSSTSPVSYSCVIQTQRTEWQVSGMAGLAWFPIGHDYYPRKLGYLNTGRNLIPSLLLATSVTSLGNAMGGIDWEPIGGLDIYAGVGSAHKTVLPGGLTLNSATVPGATVTSVTQEHAGFTIGIGLDFNSISALFAFKGPAASQP